MKTFPTIIFSCGVVVEYKNYLISNSTLEHIEILVTMIELIRLIQLNFILYIFKYFRSKIF